jgi:hypothetical protein
MAKLDSGEPSKEQLEKDIELGKRLHEYADRMNTHVQEGIDELMVAETRRVADRILRWASMVGVRRHGG